MNSRHKRSWIQHDVIHLPIRMQVTLEVTEFTPLYRRHNVSDKLIIPVTRGSWIQYLPVTKQ